MNTSSLVTVLEYSRYLQWVKLREAQHERLVNQALLHRKNRPGSAGRGHISRQGNKTRPLGRTFAS